MELTRADTGLPGAGKTLVGLQTVHAHYLDDLAVDRGSGKPTAPAVFLSGNGPLVQVLQYEVAKAYLRERYAENADARFGIVASSKDKDLVRFGISNDYQTTKRVKMGPWYGDGDGSPLSCQQFTSCVTEFGAQGLELDAALLAWGTDYVMNTGKWSNAKSSGYLRKKLVRDAFQLRLNAYRVLLTRARDAVVVFYHGCHISTRRSIISAPVVSCS
jgi:hypothetical protein